MINPKSISVRLCLILLGLAWSTGFSQVQQTEQVPKPVAGTWQGAIETPGGPLEVTVELSQEGQVWQGSIDIPAQGATDLPLERISVEQEVVSFAIAGIPGAPTFQGTLAEEEITGLYTQSGQEFPFTLTRATEEGAPSGGTREQREFEDPQGRFTVPVPTQWSVVERDGYVLIESPEAGISVYIVVSEGDEPEPAVEQAWSLVAPELTLEPEETLRPPSQAGIESTVVVNYDPEDDEKVYQAVAQLHEGTVYTMLVDADLADLQRRSSGLQIVSSGFTVSALEEDDLRGEEPLAVEAITDELEMFIVELLPEFGIPGAVVAIVQDDEIVYSQGFGVREAGGTEPMTPSTHVMIGSTGKTMTSMLVATLVDDGVVDWDTPAVEVLPEFAVADPELTQQITLRNLLCACTGVPRRDLELFFNASELDAEAIVESLESFEFFTGFGEAFQYSNQLVGTAGYAAAAAAGADYGSLFDGYVSSLDERVLQTIGMANTTLSFDEVRERGEFATPHQQSIATGGFDPIPLSFEENLLPIAPAGAHWSTAEDMARYLLTQLDVGVAPDGQRVVSEANLRETWEPQVPVSATESYGLGWFVGEYKGVDRIYHGGNTLGFTSEFTFLPEADLGIVVLANGQGTNAFNGAVTTRLLELVYEQTAESVAQIEFVLEQTESALAEAREQIQDQVDAQEVEPYLGSYRNEALGEITIEMEGEQLYIDAGEFRTEIRPAHDREGEFDTYITYGVPLTGLPIAFESSSDGEQSVVLGQGAIEYTFERVD